LFSFRISGMLPANFAGSGLDEAERRRVGVAARVDRELEVVVGVVAGGVRRERPHGAVLEALVDGEDHELAGAREARRD
jgi:hypothetical protein